MKKTVLVTAIGTATATAIVLELKKANNFYIYGADINNENEIATSLDVDEFYKFPPISNMDEYLTFVKNFCKEHKVEYYFAVLDKEVTAISREREAFSSIGTKLCVPNYDFVSVCHFKNVFAEWIRQNIPEIHIETYSSSNEITESIFPVFVKPVEGVASAGCMKIDCLEDFRNLIDKEEVGKDILVQEFLEGEHITVDLVRNKRTNQMVQVQRKEILRNGNGCGIAVKIIKNNKLENICNYLMETLDLDGIANAEFFYKNNEFRIIEINPRFSAGSLYTCKAGINTVLNAVRIADRENCEFGEIAYNTHFAERYEVYKMN